MKAIEQLGVVIWSLVPLPFLKPAWTSGSSQFMYCWSLAWRILSITLLACEMSAIVQLVWAFFGIAFLWDWNENWPFPVLWPLRSFPNLLAYWVQHFHSIIFQDLKQLRWNSITSTSFVNNAYIWNLERWLTMTLYVRQQKRHRCKNKLLDFVGAGEGGLVWENNIEMYSSICEIEYQSRFDA